MDPTGGLELQDQGNTDTHCHFIHSSRISRAFDDASPRSETRGPFVSGSTRRSTARTSVSEVDLQGR